MPFAAKGMSVSEFMAVKVSVVFLKLGNKMYYVLSVTNNSVESLLSIRISSTDIIVGFLVGRQFPKQRTLTPLLIEVALSYN
jgi:F420-0:gamma-glutamyl ligase-like protein